jgi:prolyl 4-hydroxylase
VLDRPRIGFSDGFIDARLCAWLMERAQPLQAPTRVYDHLTGRPIKHSGRTNTEATFTILELDLPMLLLRERIANTMGVPVLNLERSVVFRYEVGQTFAPHPDYLDPSSKQLAEEIARGGQRVLTFLIYLNDGFEGGETHFTRLDKRLRGGAGDALFFHSVDEAGAPEPMTEHEGASPTRGEKWLFSQFIRDREQPVG